MLATPIYSTWTYDHHAHSPLRSPPWMILLTVRGPYFGERKTKRRQLPALQRIVLAASFEASIEDFSGPTHLPDDPWICMLRFTCPLVTNQNQIVASFEDILLSFWKNGTAWRWYVSNKVLIHFVKNNMKVNGHVTCDIYIYKFINTYSEHKDYSHS